MNRIQALSALADMIASIHLNYPVRVGIDGVDASGKTMLADELVESLQARGRTVIRVSIDDFHNPRKIRYRQGRSDPQGYYDDSFNYRAIITHVLEPLGPEGTLTYRPVLFDFITDSEVHTPLQRTVPNAVLVFEGVFLHRPELRDHWDFSVFVHADFDVTIKRVQARDLRVLETPEKVYEIYEQRYIPGQQIYLDTASPSTKADVIWNNNDVENPHLVMNERTDDATCKAPYADGPLSRL